MRGEEDDRTKCYKEKGSSSHEDLSLINNFINRGFLIPRASDNVFVIHRDVTAKHRWGFFGLGKKQTQMLTTERKTHEAGLEDTEQKLAWTCPVVRTGAAGQARQCRHFHKMAGARTLLGTPRHASLQAPALGTSGGRQTHCPSSWAQKKQGLASTPILQTGKSRVSLAWKILHFSHMA